MLLLDEDQEKAKKQGEEETQEYRTEDSNSKCKDWHGMMQRRKVDDCVQEIKWKGSKASSIGIGFTMVW